MEEMPQPMEKHRFLIIHYHTVYVHLVPVQEDDLIHINSFLNEVRVLWDGALLKTHKTSHITSLHRKRKGTSLIYPNLFHSINVIILIKKIIMGILVV